jgi:hypothetical protein
LSGASKAHAYETLTPDVVLDALSDVGLAVDGRLTALSSYENRVYQVMLDDDQAVVAKFYRPERWRDEAIQEEHDFAAQLMAAEVPMGRLWCCTVARCTNQKVLHSVSAHAEAVARQSWTMQRCWNGWAASSHDCTWWVSKKTLSIGLN